MPIVENDPWRTQYFERVPCPEGVVIPTDDGDAWRLYPRHRWIYNKLLICDTQDLEAAPHGIAPTRYPVFSKPVYNLRGMGTGSAVLETAEEYERRQQPGHLWMPLLAGEHVSTDVAVTNGDPRWWRHVVGRPLGEGTFDYWTIEVEPRPALERYCEPWLRGHLRGYTGMINLETIGGKIIEAHLRFSDQWPDLYGQGFTESVVELYAEGRWTYRDEDRRTGYSLVLFGDHGIRYRPADRAVIAELLARPPISSVQITFHEGKPPERHAMPPGGFRLAIVNCWDLEAGLDARERLRRCFE